MTDHSIARVISYAFHPIMVPFYILLMVMNLDVLQYHSLPPGYMITLAGAVLLTTVIVPFLLTWMLYRLQIISSVFMPAKEDRVYPILVISVFYYLTFFLLKGVQVYAIFSFYMLGATLLAILSLILSFFSKISLHMTGVGSFTGLCIGLSFRFGINLLPEICFGILLAGIIGFARLKTNSHRPAEIYSGFLMGVFVMAVLLAVV